VETKKNNAGTITLGRVLTSAGHKLINEVAHEVRPTAEEAAPGLTKY
jgi:ribosomal protein S19E (S16A)